MNGVVVSIETFREYLESQHHEVFIFAPRIRGYQDKDTDHIFRFPPPLGFPWPKDYPLCSPRLEPRQMARLQSLVKDLKIDLVHTMHILTLGSIGLRIARDLGIPVIHTYHTLLEDYTHYIPFFPSITKAMIVRISRNFCNACDQIVTPSNPMKEILEGYGVKTPIEVIPTGVKLSEFQHPFSREELSERWGVPKDKKLLLYVSRIAEEKNLDFLFTAIRTLGHDFHLLMVGGGPQLGYYQQKVQGWGISDIVTFTGMLDKDTANRMFGAADGCFVFSSTTETQGIVLTESMAAGVPAVAVNKMGPSDIIQDGVDGFLTPLNVGEFASRIEQLLDNEELRNKFGQQAKVNAQIFSTENCGRRMDNLYEKTINHHRSQSNT